MMVELQAGDAFSIGQNGSFGQLAQLPPIDECFQDVLLDFVVAVNYG